MPGQSINCTGEGLNNINAKDIKGTWKKMALRFVALILEVLKRKIFQTIWEVIVKDWSRSHG